MPQVPPTVHLAPADADAPWADQLSGAVARACQLAQERLGLAAPDPIEVVSFGNLAQFDDFLGSRLTGVVAVAQPAARRMVIYRPAFLRGGRSI